MGGAVVPIGTVTIDQQVLTRAFPAMVITATLGTSRRAPSACIHPCHNIGSIWALLNTAILICVVLLLALTAALRSACQATAGTLHTGIVGTVVVLGSWANLGALTVDKYKLFLAGEALVLRGTLRALLLAGEAVQRVAQVDHEGPTIFARLLTFAFLQGIPKLALVAGR
jgi:hypothetical protein